MRTTRVSLLLALLLLASTLFPALSVHAAEAQPPAALADCGPADWEVLRLTNAARIAEGLNPLSVFPTLQQAANRRASEVDFRYHSYGQFSHDRPDGSKYYTVLAEFGLEYYMVAENIACLQTSPAEVMTDWMNSPGHRKNILTAELVHGGMAWQGDGWEQLFLTGYGCAYDAISILPGPEGFQLGQGKPLAELGAAICLHCAEHGDCWLPLSDELCPGADTSGLGTVRVDVVCAGLSASFDLEIVENFDGTYTEGDFTAEVRGGKATLTDWLGTSSWYSRPAVTVPDSVAGFPVVALGAELFAGAYLSAVTLPEGLEEIGDKAFSRCTLPEIALPEGLKRIGNEAFYASGLQGTVMIPASVTNLGTYAFSYCYGVSAFQVAEGNGSYCSLDGVLFNRAQTTLLNYPLSAPETVYTPPDSVTLLYCTSFAGALHLKQLYVYSPVVRGMTYTFYADSFDLWCRPDTELYAQLQSAQLVTGVQVHPLAVADIQAGPEAIEVTLTDRFTDGHFLLCAYTADGQLLALRTLSGSEVQTYTLPGTDRTAAVRLYRLDDTYAPTAADALLWSR